MEWLCLLVGLLAVASFDVGGRLTLAEILMFLTFPFVFTHRHAIFRERSFRWILILAVCYLCSQIFTDLIRHTPPEDWIRGWAKIVVFGIWLLWFGCVIDFKPRRFAYFLLGACCGGVIEAGLAEGFAMNTTMFKFVYGITLASFLVASGYLSGARIGGMAIAVSLTFLGLLSFILNARSLAGVCMLSGILSWASTGKSSFFRRLPNPAKIVLGIILATGVFGLYHIGASSGWFGTEAEEKFKMQAEKGGGSVFANARGETGASIPAIRDSPFIGHGSWAKNPKYVIMYLQNAGARLDTPNSLYLIRKALIPTHSHIFGGWVEAGLAGGVFWIFIFAFVGWTIIQAIGRNLQNLMPMICFMGMMFLWDLVFSPFGQDRRMNDAAVIVFFVVIAAYFRGMRMRREQIVPRVPAHRRQLIRA